MTWLLVVVSLAGGAIDKFPMYDHAACTAAQAVLMTPASAPLPRWTVAAYCIEVVK